MYFNNLRKNLSFKYAIAQVTGLNEVSLRGKLNCKKLFYSLGLVKYHIWLLMDSFLQQLVEVTYDLSSYELVLFLLIGPITYIVIGLF